MNIWQYNRLLKKMEDERNGTKKPFRKYQRIILFTDERQQEQRQDEVIRLQNDFINNVLNNYQP